MVNGTVNLLGAQSGSVFLAPVTVGGQNFTTVIDTGSSDPWLVTSNFACYDLYGDPEAQSYCGFGTPYNSSKSSTYSVLANENFNISYADGETLTGAMGYESFTMGGITVPKQEFGLVNHAAWQGDGYSSGLIGFAYRTLTSAYSGTDPTKDTGGQALLYNPLFVNMYTNQGVPPLFSMAINRDPYNINDGGVLALGGIPNIPYSPGFATTPIIGIGVNSTSGQTVYEFYTIVIDGFAISSDPSTQFNTQAANLNKARKNLVGNGTQVIVDSGTSLLYADNTTVAAAAARAFSPPGWWDDNYGIYFVNCSATPPAQFGVTVAGKIFYVNGVDMILYSGQDPTTGQPQCISGIQASSGLTILGDVWMKSVLCVFDLGAEVMRFAAREYSGLTQSSVPVST